MEREEKLQLMKSSQSYKEIEKCCEKYGYILNFAYRKYWVYRISICEKWEYKPTIIFDSILGGSQEFKISTISYWFLNMEEYEKFTKAINEAYLLIQELNKIDLSKLSEMPE